MSDRGAACEPMERPGSRNISLYANLACTEGGKYEKVMSGFVMRNLGHTAVLLKYFCMDPDAVFMSHE